MSKYTTLAYRRSTKLVQVKILSSQVKAMRSLGFEFVCGVNYRKNFDTQNFTNWRMKEYPFDITITLEPYQKVDLKKIVERIINQSIVNGQRDIKQKVNQLNVKTADE